MDVLEQVLSLLATTKTPYSTIARECGVSQRWLYRLASGDFSDPGVRKIHRLYEYLTREAGDAAA